MLMMDNVTLTLPESLMRRATETAAVLDRSLEEVLASAIDAALPDVGDAPIDLQRELLQMTWLSNEDLWSIAQSEMSNEMQREFDMLIEQQQQRTLVAGEVQKMEAFRREYGRITLRKARAYALLSLRSGSPLLQSA